MLLCKFYLSLFIIEPFLYFVFSFFVIKFARSAVHNTHECLLMSSKVYFVRTQNCLKLSFIELHVIFSRQLTNLVYSLSVISKQTHVLSTGKWDRLNCVG